jgi:hypothetical protein
MAGDDRQPSLRRIWIHYRPEYADHLETPKIERNGIMLWKNGRIFTSIAGKWVGLKDVDGVQGPTNQRGQSNGGSWV